MSTYVSIVVLISLLTGTLLTLMSNHWLMAWMGLEINTLAIIPFMTSSHHPRSTESTTKYFMIQATASMIIMFSIIYNASMTNQWGMTQMHNQWASLLTTISLAMKLGLAPFHFWVPEVIQGISLLPGMTLLTWQKIAPISILYQISPSLNLPLLMTLSIASTILGGWGGLNQTHLRKILAYSSIAHMGWMTIIILIMPSLTLLNLLIYFAATITLFMLFNLMDVTKINSLSNLWNKSPILMIILTTTLLSLGGLPPLTGFMSKWLILKELVTCKNAFTATMLALSALLSLFFYMRIIYSSTLTMFPSTNNSKLHWTVSPKKSSSAIPLLATISSLLLPLTPMFIILT
uniref:NADH-ubiquinone oxidoreductase chain 2 n=1 Tax=Thylamys sponsorius TaxID=938163 RepID=E7CSW4_9META|nr:NADH dehydrogenase subunit 2 [Thylamys sponsorius]